MYRNMGPELIDRTVFLEFYGLPGCGKSTISHLVAEELRNQGKKVIEPTYDVNHGCPTVIRKVVKLCYLACYSMMHSEEYKGLKRLIRSNGYAGFETFIQAANISQKLWEYDHAKSDYVIFDEGLTQSAISLAWRTKNSAENETVLYGLCKKRNALKYYVKVDVDKALERMAGRVRHDSRIEKIVDKDEQLRAIRIFEGECEKIRDDCSLHDHDLQRNVRVCLSSLNICKHRSTVE